MRSITMLPAALVLAACATAAAQNQPPRVTRIFPATPDERLFALAGRQPAAAIGVTTASGSTVRDTLGVLVSTVHPGSPAEKAGIEEGNRIASINGVSLKLAPADVGDEQMAGIMSRRLVRELDRLKPGDDVDLRVYANGQTKSIKVKTVESADLYRRNVTRADDRATLGLNLAVTGSKRDTLGVFVISVDENGPAAKAGIEEGSRIAAINGVDLRGSRADDDDFMLRMSNVRRLDREIARLKPGDDAELRVYFAGQFRTVKVKTVRASDLPRRNRATTIVGGDHIMIPPMETMPPIDRMRLDIDGLRIGDETRRAVERALEGAGRGLEGVGRALDGIGRGLGRMRVEW